DADLTGADLTDANLTDTILDAAQMEKAITGE
ncbi:MAG: pentapeptide repeat-containing protein, partial [Defluviimonas sp.]|nr:pentapeptide repeat-containing protein [Defluviimonas sp.]